MAMYAYWKLNELSGIVASDSSGNGRNGTTINTPLWVAGKLNNCLQFNGTTQGVNCNDIANFERNQTISLECWIKCSSTGIRTMISRRDRSKGSAAEGWGLLINNGQVGFQMYGINGIYLYRYSTLTNINNNNWHHVIVTYNGSSIYTGVEIYIDGSINSGTGAGTLSASILNNGICNIGMMDNGYFYFQGLIDNILIYDTVLSPADVAAHWNGGAGREESTVVTIQKTILSDAKIKIIDNQKTIVSDTKIKAINIQESILSDAEIIARELKEINSDAKIKVLEEQKTITSDAKIFAPKTNEIGLIVVNKPINLIVKDEPINLIVKL